MRGEKEKGRRKEKKKRKKRDVAGLSNKDEDFWKELRK